MDDKYRAVRRSNAFVDVSSGLLLLACSMAVLYQYLPLFCTTGYQLTKGTLDFVGFNKEFDPGSFRHRPWFNFIETDYSFDAGGRVVHASVTSLPILTSTGYDHSHLENEVRENGLLVRYDPANPDNNVAEAVIEYYGQLAIVTFAIVFVFGLVCISMTGLGNLSGERWKP